MRALRLLAVVVAGLLVVSGVVGAVAAPRDQPASTSPPVQVFVGETLDVSAVELTGGGTVGTSSVTLVGVAGEAEGRFESVDDPTDADFGGFATGAYRVEGDSDERAEFTVTEPRVGSVVVRNQNGANVTNGWEPTGENLTVTAEYNFAVADRLDVTVVAPDGLDVTSAVASSDSVTTSGGSVTLDLSDQEEGTFRITVEGSDLDRAERTVTVRTGPRRTAEPGGTPTATATSTSTETETATERPQTPTETETETPTATETQPITPTPSDTPTATATEPSTETETETETETGTETTSTSTPGFGLVAALAALAALAVAARRRR